jgi:cytochrome c
MKSATRDSLTTHVGNKLRCVSCHMGDGLKADHMPFIGVYARFPQYRPRSATVEIIEDRINDCFERSMNGKALARDSRAMRDMVAYLAFLSYGIPVGVTSRPAWLRTLTFPDIPGDRPSSLIRRAVATSSSRSARVTRAPGTARAAPRRWPRRRRAR